MNDECLEIDSSLWKMLFDHVINPTIVHVIKLLQEPKLMRNCKYSCFARGLSSSSYCQHRIREEFLYKSNYRLALIMAHRPLLSLVEGAAYFGITPDYIKARGLRYTYGKSVSFIESKAI